MIFVAAITMVLGCGPTKPGSGIIVTEEPVMRVSSNGTGAVSTEVGKRRIQIRIDLRENRLLPDGGGVQVAHRFAESAERIGQASPVPGSDNAFTFDLPDSEDLGLCEKMFYRWTVIYEHGSTNTRGTYVGQEKFVMPTSERDGNNELQQALCAE